LSTENDSGKFDGIPDVYRRHLELLNEQEQNELLIKLRLFLKDNPSKLPEGQFEAARQRMAEIEINALKKLRGKSSGEEN
jgi:DNA-directed RNA polymerase sigma subunit (sigma70/sigma32)